ncbi:MULTISPECIES: tetratricopeptide repeat protein [unclassified Micromonospora]|uniref:tetratricopeptide repeat protein n=1 Tax=unclassified Micromonospora TaxID=2617518 RepID=UPI001B38205E|nr:MULTISPECIES: tetratricopeptide repeat protein [unclassified Micromonospora]MBQ1042795.1 tetratricopeptide repeat protein [Micromonospora sp. C72]MBQ1054237.1 tetratricopeptide repeat protein [Micromonospora sp. C32]
MPSDAVPDQSAADGYLQRAHLLAELGRYDEGIGELTALLADEPGHLPALTMLARMHLAADRPAEALAVAETAVAAAPGMSSAVGTSADGAVPRSAEPPAVDGTASPAATDATAPTAPPPAAAGAAPPPPETPGAGAPPAEASSTAPPGADVTGAEQAAARSGAELSGAGTRAADTAAVVLPVLVARGLALLDLGRWKPAAATADEILARGPGDAYAQRSAAAILSASRNGQAALDAAWRGVELAPEEAEAHLVLGLVAVRLQLFDLAERAYREALRLDPELGEAGQDVGVARLERRRYAETLEQLTALADLPVARPDPVRTVDDGIRRLLLSVAGWSLLASLLAGVLAPASSGASRLFAVLAVAGVAVLLRRPATWRPGLREAMSRGLAVPVYAAAAAVVLLLAYALVGGPWPLAGAVTASVVAGLTAFARR